MANIVMKGPSTIVQGAQVNFRDGTQVIVGAGGLLTIDQKYAREAEQFGFIYPGTFGSVTAAITAHAGGGQSSATALGYGLNQVSTVATAADSVVLPAAVPGEFVTIINDAALPCQVFGVGSDTVNGVVATTGISQPGNSASTYSCVIAGQWRVIPGQGFAGGLATIGTTANGVSSNGTTLVGATPLTATLNRVTTNGAANGAVQLVAAVPGARQRVTNATANALGVFPQANEAITPGAANAVFSIPANKTAEFSSAVAAQWDAVLSA